MAWLRSAARCPADQRYDDTDNYQRHKGGPVKNAFSDDALARKRSILAENTSKRRYEWCTPTIYPGHETAIGVSAKQPEQKPQANKRLDKTT